MCNFQEQAEFYSQPIRLTEDQKGNPYSALSDFFVDYKLIELREISWQIAVVCLTTDEWPFCEPERRADLITYYKKMEVFFEAAFLVAEEYRQTMERIGNTNRGEK